MILKSFATINISPEVLHLYCPSYLCHTVTQWLFKNPRGVDWNKSCGKEEKSTKWCILQGCPDQAKQEEVNQQSTMPMMIPTMMTLSILMTNKCLQAIRMQNHHNINSLFAHILISVATLPSYHHVITLPYRHGPKNHMGDTFTEKSWKRHCVTW